MDRAASEDEIKKMMVDTMKRAGIEPARIYAFEKTGRIVTEDNQSQLTAQDIAEWNAAIDEYRAKHQ